MRQSEITHNVQILLTERSGAGLTANQIAAELKLREATLLLEALPGDAATVALDEAGKELSSEQFAKQLGRWRDDGRATIAFMIGGADGLTGEVRDRADLVLSLGRQTWPHMLVRAMLAEQLYRAWSINTGHPYHRV